MRCWRCNEEQAPTLLCARCEAVQKPGRDLDHFAALGLSRHPLVDEGAVATRYYDLSRKVHPDRFQTASPDELAASIEATAALNSAYQTLRDVESRGRYWLKCVGDELSGEGRRVPPAIAELVFDVQEKLADLRGSRGPGIADAALLAEVAERGRDIAARRSAGRARVEQLLATWPAEATHASSSNGDAGRLRAELAQILAELSYLRTLERDVRLAIEERDDHHGTATGAVR